QRAPLRPARPRPVPRGPGTVGRRLPGPRRAGARAGTASPPARRGRRVSEDAGVTMPEPAPAGWAPAHRTGTAYHRLATLRPEWASRSKPLLAVLATFIAYVVLASVLLVGSILALALLPGVNIALGIISGDPTSPLD